MISQCFVAHPARHRAPVLVLHQEPESQTHLCQGQTATVLQLPASAPVKLEVKFVRVAVLLPNNAPWCHGLGEALAFRIRPAPLSTIRVVMQQLPCCDCVPSCRLVHRRNQECAPGVPGRSRQACTEQGDPQSRSCGERLLRRIVFWPAGRHELSARRQRPGFRTTLRLVGLAAAQSRAACCRLGASSRKLSGQSRRLICSGSASCTLTA